MVKPNLYCTFTIESKNTQNMKITFWRNNRKDQEHKVEINQILKEYKNTPESKMQVPFERNILIFMMDNYGAFEGITDEQWDELHKELRTN